MIILVLENIEAISDLGSLKIEVMPENEGIITS
jgi:hypothetical protein